MEFSTAYYLVTNRTVSVTYCS